MSPDAQIYDIETYQPAGCVGQLMYRVRSAQMSALDEALGQDPDLASLEVSAAQYIIISVLAKRGVDSPVQLCKDLSYDAGAMTRMLDRLERRGLVRRVAHPNDRRTSNLELTAEGKAVYPKLRASAMKVLNRFLHGFTQKEARQLESFLQRMLENG